MDNVAVFLLSCSASAREGAEGCIYALLGVTVVLGKQRKRQLRDDGGLPRGVVLDGRCGASGSGFLTLEEAFQEDLGILYCSDHLSTQLTPNDSGIGCPLDRLPRSPPPGICPLACD